MIWKTIKLILSISIISIVFMPVSITFGSGISFICLLVALAYILEGK